MALFRKVTGVQATPKAPSTKTATQFPRDWFKDHPGSKPILNLTLVLKDLPTARRVIRKLITDHNLDIDVVKTFLYYFLQNVSSKLNEEWSSYDVVIGSKDQEITPLDLVEVSTQQNLKELPGVDRVEETDDAWMALYVISIYRLIKAKQNTYKGQIATRISQQIKALKTTGQDISEVVDLYTGWNNDRGYNCLIGITDMFFNKFPNHNLANLRIGTTGSRFKDCAGLISFGYIISTLGMPNLTDFYDWIFVEQIGNELDKMMIESEELDLPHSYFPYQVDLGLVTKSSYSSVANPHFFELVHLTGALLRSQRSMNAKHIFSGQPMNLLLNAGCIAYVNAHTFRISKVYVQKDEIGKKDTDSEPDDDLDPDDLVSETLKSNNPYEWVRMLKGIDYQMPNAVRKFIKDIGHKIREPREGTMDEHLSRIADTL